MSTDAMAASKYRVLRCVGDAQNLENIAGIARRQFPPVANLATSVAGTRNACAES